jgi:hypothetical protein
MYKLHKWYCKDYLLVMYDTQNDITIGDALTNFTNGVSNKETSSYLNVVACLSQRSNLRS